MNKLSDEILKRKYDEIYNNFMKGDYLDVIKECNEVLKKRKHQLFFNLLCVAYQKIGKIEKSIDVMNEALTLNPEHPNFLNNLGLCFYMLHKFSEAEKNFKKGLEIDEISKNDGPAAKAGMIKGDVIKSINNIPISNIYEYMDRLSNLKPGTTIPMIIERNGQKRVLQVTF